MPIAKGIRQTNTLSLQIAYYRTVALMSTRYTPKKRLTAYFGILVRSP